MAQTSERQAPERTVIINGSEGRNGGMGMGIMLGAILVVVLGLVLLWFAFGGRMPSSTDTPTGNTNNPSINIDAPDIKIPDSITINTPNMPESTPAP